MKFLWLFIGGGIGTILRYLISLFGNRIIDGNFPLGTLIANVVGAFTIGLLFGIFMIEDLMPEARLFIFTGVLGGFTTFSSFMLESLNLFRESEAMLGITNIMVTNLLGFFAVYLGFTLSKLITRG